MLQCWRYDPHERPPFTELVSIIQSQTTIPEAFVMEIISSDADTPPVHVSTPNTNNTLSQSKAYPEAPFPHVLLSEEPTGEGDRSLPSRTDSCFGCPSSHFSDSSGGYLQFDEDHLVKSSATAPQSSDEGYIANEMCHLGVVSAMPQRNDVIRAYSADSGIIP